MKKKIKFYKDYFNGAAEIAKQINIEDLERLTNQIKIIKKNKGRIFFLGVGGSAGNCSHAVNDFRKLCNIECYTPLDNVSELTARINDEGWNNSFVGWLKGSNLNRKDAIFIFSVGGGSKQKNISYNIVKAIDYATQKKARVLGVIGKKDGYANKKGNCIVVVPEVEKKLVTPLSESFQSVIWHCLVSHPKLQTNKTKW